MRPVGLTLFFLCSYRVYAELFLVHLSSVLNRIEMVTVFSDLCIKTEKNLYYKFECGGSGTIVVSYFSDDECLENSGDLKSLLVSVDEWSTIKSTYTVDHRFKHVQLFCSRRDLDKTFNYMQWTSSSENGLLFNYYPGYCDKGSPAISQYVRKIVIILQFKWL